MSTAPSDIVTLDNLPWPVRLRRHDRARSLKLRADERSRQFVLTLPKRASRRHALDWANGQSAWARGVVASAGELCLIESGATIFVQGREVLLEWREDLPRLPSLAGSVLQAGGTESSFPGRIERFLKGMARDTLTARTIELARDAGLVVRSVAIGDAASRWGSCSSSGAIRYNWRLIMAPPHLLDWVVAHEVAHLAHLNHGPDFKRLEARLYAGNVAAARAELRGLSAQLKGLRRLV